jgi:hypothetical protein
VGLIIIPPEDTVGLPTLSAVAIATGFINTTPVVNVGLPTLSALAMEAGTITKPPTATGAFWPRGTLPSGYLPNI